MRCPNKDARPTVPVVAVAFFVTVITALFATSVLANSTYVKLPIADNAKGYLAACLLVRDAHLDVRDWVEWHHLLGVEKIFLFDHNSTPPLFDEVSDFISDGLVQYLYFKSDLPDTPDFADSLLGRVRQQCFAQARGYYSWMLFTDVDEFALVADPQYGNSLPSLLRRYEGAGAVLAHWRYFGSGGLRSRPPGSPLMTTFTQCMTELNGHVKGIANLNHSSLGVNSHSFTYEPGYHGVRVGDDQVVHTSHWVDNPPASPPLVLLHYLGSQAEWRHQLTRLTDRHVTGRGGKQAGWYEHVDAAANSTCSEGREAFERLLAPRRRPHPGGCARQQQQGVSASAAALAMAAAARAEGPWVGAAFARFAGGKTGGGAGAGSTSAWSDPGAMLLAAFLFLTAVVAAVQWRRIAAWLGKRPRPHG